MPLCSPYLHTIPYILDYAYLACQTLPNAPIRSPSALRVFKRSKILQYAPKRSEPFQDASKRSSNVPKHSQRSQNVPKHSQYAIMRLLTYIPYIHIGLCCQASLACQTLPYDPKSLQTHSNGCKRLQTAPQRCQTFPNYLSTYAYLHTITYHTTPYGMMDTIPRYTPQKPYIWDSCIKSCMCSSFRLAPSHDAYAFHARSTLGFCICL